MSARLRFWKLTGAGNDFVVVDARDGQWPPAADLARLVCPRRVAVGADGLIAIVDAREEQVVVDFRNADGSLAGFCGNGARCVARLAVLTGLARSPFTLVFPALTVRAEVLGEDVRITGPRPQPRPGELTLMLDEDLPIAGRRISAGVDHVVFADPRPETPLAALARSFFAAHPELEREVNLTFVRPGAEGTILVRTFERGVGETLACGSGALAAAEFTARAPGDPVSVVAVTPGGARLAVELGAGDGPAVLTGEARLVYEGEFAPEALARGR